MENKKQNIVVIDYGMGNLGSVSNMLKFIGANNKITSDLDQIRKADKLILPGVGHFDKAIQNIHQLNLMDTIKKKVLIDQIPILGICLGMQLLCNNSEEGQGNGFGFIEAQVKKFKFSRSIDLKVPHMGWNQIKILKNDSKIIEGLEDKTRFYFVHSYYVKCNKINDILTKTVYGNEFVSSFEKNNIIGVQFHPEKSHKFGIKLFSNFINRF